MIIYLCLFIPFVIHSGESSSIRGRNFKNDLVPSLSSRSSDPVAKDNSLKIVSNEPFIIQFNVPDSSERREGESKGRDKKKRKKLQQQQQQLRLAKKRDPKHKPLRKKHRIRRHAEDTRTEEPFADTNNSITRQDIFKALTQFKRNKTAEDPNSKSNGLSYRLHLPPSERAPIVRMVYPPTPKLDKRPHKYTHKDLVHDRERLEQKIKYLKNILNVTDIGSTGSDSLRVRRKTEADKTANKVAKMFLTLSAVNGLHDRKKSRCKDAEEYDSEEENREDVWEKERRDSDSKRSSSSNEERYKVKKWIEFMKNARSSGKTCPCMDAYADDNDVFPLEKKLAKGRSPLDRSSEESSESFMKGPRARLGRNGLYRSRHSRDEQYKGCGNTKFEVPLQDLEVYRSRAKQILRNAEEILDKIKEEEEKRKSTPNILLSQLKELTSRIQGDPRNNENDLIRLIQKNLGWSPFSRSDEETASQGSSFIDNMKSYVLDPYEKAKSLTDESTKKLTTYLLKNLGKLDDSSQDNVDEVQKKPEVYQGQDPIRKDDELSSANLAKEAESGPSKPLKSFADSILSIFKSGEDKQEAQVKEEDVKRTKAEEEQLKRRMEDMLKEQEKKLGEYTEAPNLQPDSHEFEIPKSDKDVVGEKHSSLENEKDEDDDDCANVSQSSKLPTDRRSRLEALRKLKPTKPCKKKLKKLKGKGVLGKQSKNGAADDEKQGENVKKPEETDAVASENPEDASKSISGEVKPAEDKNEVTASEHLQEPKKPEDSESDKVNEKVASADKSQDLKDLEKIKAEIESKERELKKEEEALMEETAARGQRPDKSKVLQSKHKPESGESRKSSKIDPKDREENEVLESKYLIPKFYQEPEDEQPKPSQGGEESVQRTETDKEVSDESESVEDVGKVKEEKVESSETDTDKSEEGQVNTQTDTKTPSADPEGIVRLQETTGDATGNEEKVESESVKDPETQEPIMDENAQEKVSAIATADNENGEEGPGEDNQPDKINEEPIEKTGEDVPEARLRATQGEKEAEEALQAVDPDGDSIVRENLGETEEPLEASKPEEETAELTKTGESEESRLREKHPDESSPKEDSDDDGNDETPLRNAKPEESDSQEDPVRAANPTQQIKNEMSEGKDETVEAASPAAKESSADETPLKSAKMEKPSEESGENLKAENPMEVTDSEREDETLRASNTKSKELEDEEPSLKVMKKDEVNRSGQKEDFDDEETPLRATNAESTSSKQEKDSDDDETPLRAAKMDEIDRSTEKGSLDDEETPLRAPNADKASSKQEKDSDDDETPLREVNLGENAGSESGEDVATTATKERADDEEKLEDIESNETPLRSAYMVDEMEETEDDDTPLRAAKTDMEEKTEDDEGDTPLRAAKEEMEEKPEDQDDTSLRATKTDMEEETEDDDSPLRAAKGEMKEDGMGDEIDENSLKLAKPAKTSITKLDDSEVLEKDSEENPLRAANADDEMREENVDNETPLRQSHPEDIPSDEVKIMEEVSGDTPLEAPHPKMSENENENEVDDTPLRAAAEDLNNEIDQNLNGDLDEESPLRAAKPVEVDNLVSEDQQKKDDNVESLLRKANTKGDLTNELEENPETVESILRGASSKEEDSGDQIIAQEKLDVDDTPLRAANLEKDLDGNELEERKESWLKAAKAAEEELDDEESLRRAANSAEVSNEERIEDIDEGGSLRAAHKEEDMESETLREAQGQEDMEDETLKARHEEESMEGETVKEAQEDMDDWSPLRTAHDDENDITPLREANPKMATYQEIYDDYNDETPLRAVIEDEIPRSLEDIENEDSSKLRAENPEEAVNDSSNQDTTHEDDDRDELHLKSANPLEDLNTPRYKLGEEDENLSEEFDDKTPLRASNPLEDSGSRLQIPLTPKSKKLHVPKSIGQILRDLEGNNRGEASSDQNLDPEEIDQMIDKIGEAEQENRIGPEEVDCQKECRCAENVNVKSRNIGRYEIVKDFLHWFKDLQVNQVLADD